VDRALRVASTILIILVVEGVVCALALLGPVLMWGWVLRSGIEPIWLVVLVSALAVPSYLAFAIALMVLSAAATRLTGARTPDGLEARIADCDWALMRWVRAMVAAHLVRVVAGTILRGSPVWTAYLRLNGARIGRRVYINSLFVSDHNLLEFGDDVVIGSEVHLSGHTVEHGLLRTGTVRLGSKVTVGLGTVVDIDVVVGPSCQIGALSFVPKHARLEGGAVYAGVPVQRIR
jgi:non-ribosomal peptide synthetase-like protein